MITDFVFCEDVKDLETLTGLTEEELWKNGFNLDDMDFAVVTSVDFGDTHDDVWNGDLPFYGHWLFDRMDSYCVGYYHTKYKDKHYYTVHHS